MHERRCPSVAFVGWNPFQFRQALPVARALPGSVMVIEKRGAFASEFPESLLTTCGVPVVVWKRTKMAQLDGVFDVIVCQTIFSQIERFRSSKIAMLQYGLAKEPHNYGAWRSLADLCLVYGAYSERKASHFAPAVSVGNPRFDEWGTPGQEARAHQLLAPQLDPSRKTILYAPTWGELSTQDDFLASVMDLSRHYNVLLKLHHNTALLEQSRACAADPGRVVVLGANDDLLDALAVSDVVLSDYSGAIFDALYCGKPVALLRTPRGREEAAKLDEYSLEVVEQDRIGPVVADADALPGTVAELLSNQPYRSRNAALVSELFVRGPGAAARAAAALEDLAAGRIARQTQLQGYVRDEIRKNRRKGIGSRSARSERSAAGGRNIEWALVDHWAESRKHRRVLRYVTVRNRVQPKLYLYRAGIRAAERLDDTVAAARLLERATKHFPDSSLAGEQRDASIQKKTGRRAPSVVNRFRVAVRGVAQNARHGALEPIRRLMVRAGMDSAIRAYEQSGVDPTPKQGSQLARYYRDQQDDVSALRVLTLSQRTQPGNRVILMRAADALRDDKQFVRAHAFLRLAQRVYPAFGTVRVLGFESDMGWFEQGEPSLDAALALPPATLKRFLRAVNRVGVYYPDRREALAAARVGVRTWLEESVPSTTEELDKAVTAALESRWLDLAERLLERGADRGLLASLPIRNRLQAMREALGSMNCVLDAAWHNEQADELLAFEGGAVRPLRGEETADPKVVEFFIPTAFFAFDDTEKPTYATVRSMFRMAFEALVDRDDVVLVPRMQLNWRYAARRLEGRSVSYHTHGPFDPSRLHVQEAPLAGHCSMDHAGFAGFSSIARDFATIERATAAIPRGELESNHRKLVDRFVRGNVSKYTQAEEAVELPERYVFLPMQIQTDIVADLAFVDGLELLRTLADFYDGTGISVVVKRHPFCHSVSVQTTLEELAASGKIVVSSASVHSLITGAETVYTVNSGVGLEALLQLKRVVTTGHSDYAYAASVAHGPDELVQLARRPPEVDITKILRFLHFYTNRWLVSVDAPDAVQRRLRRWLEPPAAPVRVAAVAAGFG